MTIIFRLSYLFSALSFLALPLQAATLTYSATLSGAAEVPAVASPGTGTVKLTYDTLTDNLRLQTQFSDLIAPVTAAHIHGFSGLSGNAGVIAWASLFPGFPVSATSGTFDHTFNIAGGANLSPGFVAAYANGDAAKSAFLAGLAEGKTYFNIHTLVYPAGELRGNLLPTAVPLPATLPLALAGLAGFGLLRRRRHVTVCY